MLSLDEYQAILACENPRSLSGSSGLGRMFGFGDNMPAEVADFTNPAYVQAGYPGTSIAPTSPVVWSTGGATFGPGNPSPPSSVWPATTYTVPQPAYAAPRTATYTVPQPAYAAPRTAALSNEAPTAAGTAVGASAGAIFGPVGMLIGGALGPLVTNLLSKKPSGVSLAQLQAQAMAQQQAKAAASKRTWTYVGLVAGGLGLILIVAGAATGRRKRGRS